MIPAFVPPGARPARVVGLCGRSGAGKTTLARLLADALQNAPNRPGGPSGPPAEVRVASFADGVRAVVRNLWGVSTATQEEKAAPLLAHLPAGPTRRDALIAIGEAARSVDPRVWVHALDRRLGDAGLWAPLLRPRLVILDDVRTVEEAEYVHSRGGKVVYVLGRLHNRHPSYAEAAAAIPTERPWALPYDAVLTNDSTPAEGARRLAAFLSEAL